MKIAVCLHLFYDDMLQEIINFLNNLEEPYKLYVTMIDYKSNTLEVLKKIKQDVKIINVENKGVDVGGFLNTLKFIDEDTDLVLKIHTKKGIGSTETPSNAVRRFGVERTLNKTRIWFHELMNGVLGGKDFTKKIIDTFKKNNECGMVGFRLYNNLKPNENKIKEVIEIMKLNVIVKDYFFVGGTIFWIDYKILRKYFTDEIIDNLLEKMENNYVCEPSIQHALERIFGLIVYNENKKIFTLN